tara:strand:+ start:8625 stop:9344 length:720 start_codon:yes stop_codon:yes gene_type:complete
MELKDYKKTIGIFYLIILFFAIFLIYYNQWSYYFSPEYLFNNKENLLDLKNKYLLQISVIFFFFTIIWTLFLGFSFPLFILTGFFFNVIYGTFLLLIGKTIGSTILYIIANIYFKKSVQNYFDQKHLIFKKAIKNIKKNELSLLILTRFIPAPVQVSDLAPVLINAKVSNYIIAKFFGSLVPHLIIINMIRNFFEFYQENDSLNINLFQSKEFLIAITIFILFLIVGRIIKKKYLTNIN